MKKNLHSNIRSKAYLALILGVFAVTTYGQTVGTKFTFDSITFEFTSENHIKAIEYAGTETEVTVHRTAKYQDTWFLITAIGNKAFEGKGLTSVTFVAGSGIVSIEEDAFNNNQLSGIGLPNTIENIGKRAFGNNQLIEVTIPGKVGTIEEQAFYKNPNLTLVTVDASVPPTLHVNAFQDPGRGQIDLVVPKDALGDYQDQSKGWTEFGSMHEVGTVGSMFISKSVTYQVISVDPGKEVEVTNYHTAGGVFEIPETTGNKGETYAVTAIGNEAFRGKELTSVLIPNTVSRIGSNAFNDNPSLRTLVIEATTPPDLVAANAFTNRDQIDVFVPRGTIDTYNQPSYGWTGFKSIADTQLFDWIGVDHITYHIVSLTQKLLVLHEYTGPGGVVNIPAAVEYGPNTFTARLIWIRAFRIANVTEVTIPSSVERIMNQAFDFNPNLTLVTVERDDPPVLDGTPFVKPYKDQIDLVVPMGRKQAYLDGGWTGFKSLTYGIFTNNDIKYGISSSTEVEITDYIGTATEVDIPGTVDDNDETYTITTIGDGAFRQKELTRVTMLDGITSIGTYAFANNQLTSVNIPNSVTNIAQWAFSHNRNLSFVRVEANNPPALSEETFQNPGRDQIDLIVPVGTKDEYLANGWTGFKSITHGIITNNDIKYEITSPTEVEIVDYTGSAGELVIPETIDNMGETYTVTTIGDDVFNDSPDLTLITVEINDPPTLHEGAFQNPGRDQIDLVVPMGKRQVYLDNGWTGFKSITYGIFTDDYIKYGITASAEVEIIEYTGSATAMVIPEIVDDKGQTYTVTAIGSSAFNNNIELATVKIEATNPPLLHENTFADRSQIDLEVPAGKRQAYLDNGWSGFKSITETQVLNVQEGDQEFNDFIVHPNPASDKVHIDAGIGYVVKHVNIYTMTGAYLYSENGPEINTSSLSEGMYLFEVVTKTGEKSLKKVIIK